MNFLSCKHISKDGFHLETDYLKNALAADPDAWTCKAPANEFKGSWVFGIAKYSNDEETTCGGNYYEKKRIEAQFAEKRYDTGQQLSLFQSEPKPEPK